MAVQVCGVTYDPDAPPAAQTRVHVVTVGGRPKGSPVLVGIVIAMLVGLGAIVGSRFVRQAHSLDVPQDDKEASVQNGRPEVLPEVGRAILLGLPQPLHPHPSARPLAEVMRDPAVRHALKPVPFFTGYLIYLDREGWAWYITTLANESMPRIRARDGAVWPYRR